jgi:outer membrane protein TolC
VQEIVASQRPVIKAIGNAVYSPHSTQVGYDPAITDGGQIGAQIALQTPRYSWGGTALKIKRSTIDQKQLQAQLAKIERDVALSVKQKFIEGLRGHDEFGIWIEAKNRLSDYLSRVQIQYKGGLAGYSDIFKTKTQLLAAQEMLEKAQEAIALSKISLSDLIGASVDTAVF